MLPVRLRREALAELADAWAWYEDQRRGLGDEFRACVDDAIASIARDPLLHAVVGPEVRRGLVRRFPYGIFFVVEPRPRRGARGLPRCARPTRLA